MDVETRQGGQLVRSVQDSKSGEVRTWVLTGPGGATSFSVIHPGEEHEQPLAIGIHALANPFPGDGAEPAPCDVLPQGRCFGDAAYRAAHELRDYWVATGRRDNAIYTTLTDWYDRKLAH